MKKMAEKYSLKIGNQVSFNYKGTTTGTIVKINPKKALVQFDGDKLIRVPYSMLKVVGNTTTVTRPTVEKFTFQKSTITTNQDLKRLMEEVKDEYSSIFDTLFNALEKDLLNKVVIKFGARVTYRNCGWYKPRFNLIQITASFKKIPEYVIKATIFHELLHIKIRKHGSMFRRYERMYKKYFEANEFVGKLFKDIRINGTNYLNFRSEPTKQEIKKPIKKPSSSKPKTNPKPVVKVEESDIDRRWRLIQEKKKRQNQELHR